MSKRKTIDAFLKKKDVSNSKFKTPVAVETNVNTLMSDEHPSKCPKLQSEEINRDPGTRKQICEFPINKQDEIRRVYLKEGPYQPKYIDCPYNDDNHRCQKLGPQCKKSWLLRSKRFLSLPLRQSYFPAICLLSFLKWLEVSLH